MTISTCQSFCLASDYPFAALEYASQCFCGNSLASNTSSTACTMACVGNASQICGGGFALSLYAYMGFIAPLQTTPKIGNYRYQGCWTDSMQNSGRSLKGSVSRVCTGCLVLEFRGGGGAARLPFFLLRSFGDFRFTGKQTTIEGSIENKL